MLCFNNSRLLGIRMGVLYKAGYGLVLVNRATNIIFIAPVLFILYLSVYLLNYI